MSIDKPVSLFLLGILKKKHKQIVEIFERMCALFTEELLHVLAEKIIKMFATFLFGTGSKRKSEFNACLR